MDISTKAAGARLGRRAHARGLTLTELMITLAVAGILMVIGVPSFRNASLGSRLSAAANDLLASVQLARSEAIKRNVAVTLCASANGATCAGSGGWEQGWIILAAGTVIQVQQGLPSGYLLRQAGGTAPVSFKPIGMGASAATFKACRNDPDGSQERVLTMTAAGMAFVTRTATGSCP